MGAVLMLTTAVGCTAPNPMAGQGNGAVGQQGGGPKKDNAATAPDTGPTSQDCTYTQGYWKNHDGWPVSSLTLGSRSYSKAELQSIFGQAVQGNGLVSLAHQLIAAKLNLAQGANGSALGTAIADADAMIGGLVVPPVGSGSLPTATTSSLVASLTSFNQGDIGPGHCGDQPPPPPPPVCGDGKVDPGEECDGGEGCSESCTKLPPPPPPPYCGDGNVDPGEECDGGEGCSESCTKLPPPPPPCGCGNGILEEGEQCDDGNTTDGDGCSATCEIECTPPPPPPCGG